MRPNLVAREVEAKERRAPAGNEMRGHSSKSARGEEEGKGDPVRKENWQGAKKARNLQKDVRSPSQMKKRICADREKRGPSDRG